MNRRSSAGFTLLEVLVALAVGALALSSLAASIVGMGSVDRKLSDRVTNYAEIDGLFTLVETLCRHFPMRLKPQTLRVRQEIEGWLQGGPSNLAVLSRGPAVLGLPQPARFELTYVPEASGTEGRIQLTWSREGSPETELVVRKSSGLAFQYGRRSEAKELIWSSTWLGFVEDLAAVRIAVKTPWGVKARVFEVLPTLPRICALQPLLDGCPRWQQ